MKESDIVFAREGYKEAKDCGDIISSNWQESGGLFGFNIDIDWGMHDLLEKQGLLKCYYARANGEIVGYQAYSLATHHHCKGLMVAHQMVVFLTEGYRLGLTGKRFISFAEDDLRSAGAKVILQYSSVKKDLSKFYKRNGYTLIEQSYMKRL